MVIGGSKGWLPGPMYMRLRSLCLTRSEYPNGRACGGRMTALQSILEVGEVMKMAMVPFWGLSLGTKAGRSFRELEGPMRTATRLHWQPRASVATNV